MLYGDMCVVLSISMYKGFQRLSLNLEYVLYT